jgi:cytochrome c oxidase subunit 3
MMFEEMTAERKKIHPHKFTLWVGLGSIVMMFAGLTSAYIVKRSQANWVSFDLPVVFWISTIVMVASSLTVFLAQRNFKERLMQRYKSMMIASSLLGVLFIGLQVAGFTQLWNAGITLQASVSFSFLYVIVGLHAVHVIGGVLALWIMLLKSFSNKVRNYSTVPVELMSTYWHFVDLLWIYLLVFLLMIR